MKKILCTFLTSMVVLFTTPVLAQSATTIDDLMGDRPSNSYYQNSGLQTQGSAVSSDAASASVLQQEFTGNLKVDAPTAPAQTVTEEKSSNWWPAVLIGLFVISAVWLIILGAIAKKQAIERNKKTATKPVPKKSTKKNPKKPSKKSPKKKS